MPRYRTPPYRLRSLGSDCSDLITACCAPNCLAWTHTLLGVMIRGWVHERQGTAADPYPLAWIAPDLAARIIESNARQKRNRERVVAMLNRAKARPAANKLATLRFAAEMGDRLSAACSQVKFTLWAVAVADALSHLVALPRPTLLDVSLIRAYPASAMHSAAWQPSHPSHRVTIAGPRAPGSFAAVA